MPWEAGEADCMQNTLDTESCRGNGKVASCLTFHREGVLPQDFSHSSTFVSVFILCVGRERRCVCESAGARRGLSVRALLELDSQAVTGPPRWVPQENSDPLLATFSRLSSPQLLTAWKAAPAWRAKLPCVCFFLFSFY